MSSSMDIETLRTTPRRTRLTRVALASRQDPQLASFLYSASVAPAPPPPPTSNEPTTTTTTSTNPDSQVEPDIANMLAAPQAMVPETSYDILEAAFVAAAASKDGEAIARLVALGSHRSSRKALMLATHVVEAVDDATLVQMFNTAKELDKCKILRTAATERGRESFLDLIVPIWLQDKGERRIVACEVLHGCSSVMVKKHIREIMVDAQLILVSSPGIMYTSKPTSRPINTRAVAQVHFAEMWRRHSRVLLELIRDDFKAKTDHLHNHCVWTLWTQYCLSPTMWVGASTKPALATRFARTIPWKIIYELWRDYLPLRPRDQELSTWMYWLYLSSYEDGDTTTSKLNLDPSHEVVKQLVEESLQGKVQVTDERVIITLPPRFEQGYLGPKDADFYVEFATSLVCDMEQLVGVPEHLYEPFEKMLLAGISRLPPRHRASRSQTKLPSASKRKMSTNKYRLLLTLFKRVSAAVTPALFYGLNNLPKQSHSSQAHYDARVATMKTFTHVQKCILEVFFDQNSCQLSTGEVLESYSVILAFHKRMVLEISQALPSLVNPPVGGLILSLFVQPDAICTLVEKHAEWITSFTNAVVAIVGHRLVHALDRTTAMTREEGEEAQEPGEVIPQGVATLRVVFSTLVQGYVTTYKIFCTSLESIQQVFPLYANNAVEPAFRLAEKLDRVSCFSPMKHKIGHDLASNILINELLPRAELALTEQGTVYQRKFQASTQIDSKGRRYEALDAMFECQVTWVNKLCGAMAWIRWNRDAQTKMMDWLIRSSMFALDTVRDVNSSRFPQDIKTKGAISLLNAVEGLMQGFLNSVMAYVDTPQVFSNADEVTRITNWAMECVWLWGSVKFDRVHCDNPLPRPSSGGGNGARGPIHPRTHAPLFTLMFSFPIFLKEKFEKVFIHPYIVLSLRDEYEVGLATQGNDEQFQVEKLPPSENTRGGGGRRNTSAAAEKATPSAETIAKVKTGFDTLRRAYANDALTMREAEFKSRLVDLLERASPNSSKDVRSAFDEYFNMTDVAVRKRLEQDLVKAVDRVTAFQTWIKATINSHNQNEFYKTMSKVMKTVSSEILTNKRAMVQSVITMLIPEILCMGLPDPLVSQGQSSIPSKRLMAAKIIKFPTEAFPDLLANAQVVTEKFPTLLIQLVEMYYNDQEEKSSTDHVMFENLANMVLGRALTWVFAKSHPVIQQQWFDAAIEIKSKLHTFSVGKGKVASTFSLSLSPAIQKQVSVFLFEQGSCPDWIMPLTSTEMTNFIIESRARRLQACTRVVTLVQGAYASVLKTTQPFGLVVDGTNSCFSFIERTRFEEVLKLVQGTWQDIPYLSDFVTLAMSTLEHPTLNSVIELHAMMRTVANISLVAAFAIDAYQPEWFAMEKKHGSGIRPVCKPGQAGIKLPHVAAVAAPVGEDSTTRGRTKKHTVKKGRGSVRKAHAPPTLPEAASWFGWKEIKHVPVAVVKYLTLALEMYGIHHPSGVHEGRAILRAWLRARMGSSEITSLAQKRETRDAICLDLLRICASAVHLSLVQGHIMERRPELLKQYVLNKDANDPILGKFSPVPASSPSEAATSPETTLANPFRLYGVYNFRYIFSNDCVEVAHRIIQDAKSSNQSTMSRISSVSKLQFVPSVDPMLLFNLYGWHQEQIEQLEQWEKKKKANEKDVQIGEAPVPLPDGAVAATLRALFQHDNPYKALALMLSPGMISKTSTKETSAVALRLLETLNKDQLVKLCHILLNRRGGQGLRVGAVKAFLNILNTLSKEGHTMASVELKDVWDHRHNMHVDAQALICGMAMSCVARAGGDAVSAEWAWNILESIATETNGILAEIRLLFIQLHPPNTAPKIPDGDCGLNYATITSGTNTMIEKANAMVEEITMEDFSGAVSTWNVIVSRYLKLMLKACDVLEKEAAQESAAAAAAVEVVVVVVTGKESQQDIDKKNAAQRQHIEIIRRKNTALDVRAVLFGHLAKFLGCVDARECERILRILGGLITARGYGGDDSDEEAAGNDTLTRNSIVDSVIPRQIACVCSCIYAGKFTNTFTGASDEFKVEEWLANEILADMIRILMGPLTLEGIGVREKMSTRFVELVNCVDDTEKPGGPHYPPLSLRHEAVVDKFGKEISLLRREAAVASSVKGMFEGVQIGGGGKR